MPPRKRKSPTKKVAPVVAPSLNMQTSAGGPGAIDGIPTQVECDYLTCPCITVCKRETAS